MIHDLEAIVIIFTFKSAKVCQRRQLLADDLAETADYGYHGWRSLKIFREIGLNDLNRC